MQNGQGQHHSDTQIACSCRPAGGRKQAQAGTLQRVAIRQVLLRCAVVSMHTCPRIPKCHNMPLSQCFTLILKDNAIPVALFVVQGSCPDTGAPQHMVHFTTGPAPDAAAALAPVVAAVRQRCPSVVSIVRMAAAAPRRQCGRAPAAGGDSQTEVPLHANVLLTAAGCWPRTFLDHHRKCSTHEVKCHCLSSHACCRRDCDIVDAAGALGAAEHQPGAGWPDL